MTFQPPAGSANAASFLRLPASRGATARVLDRFSRLDPDDLAALEAALEPAESVSAEAVLSQPSSAPAFAVSDGWLGLARQTAEGRRQILSLFLPGDVIGLDTATAPLQHGKILALTPARIRRLPVQGRALIALRPRLIQALAAHNLQHQARLQDQIFRIGALPAFERVAHLLGELHKRLGAEGDDRRRLIPVRQEILAQTLGLSLVHINRTLHALSDQRLAWLDRGRLVVPDEAALEAAWASPSTRET